MESSIRHCVRTLALITGVVAIAAVAGFASAEPALATTSCTEIFGSGSSLQGIAQTEVWIADWPGCTGGSITYTATTTSDGLEEFGNFGGKLEPEDDPTANPTLDAYVAVDNAPNAGELGEAKAAEGGKEITIPVAQAPVSVLLSLPAKCTVTGGANIQIPTDILEEVWYGTLEASGTYAKDTWGALLKQSYSSGKSPVSFTNSGSGSTGCGETIRLQARSNAAGTSFIFKSYLSQVNYSNWKTYASEYDSWPVSVTTTGNTSNALMAQDVVKTPGSIGYADAADAASSANGAYTGTAKLSTFGSSASHDILWAQVQDSEESTEKEVKFAFAAPSSTSVGNCSSSVKVTPPSNIYDTWYSLLVSSPTIGGGYYPICGLDYMLAFHEYTETSYGKSVCEVAATVSSYTKFVTNASEGQTDIKSHYYAPMPSAVTTKAKEAAEAVGTSC
jgi:ABC-type phosphate transport system substrate-binding protein